MNFPTVESLTKEMITLLAACDDGKEWKEHGGKDDKLAERIMARISEVETGHMQNVTDEARVDLIEKAFRLNMYGALVDIWKELVAIIKSGNKTNQQSYVYNLRKWWFTFIIAAEKTGRSLFGNEPFIKFPDAINVGNQHYMSNTPETVQELFKSLQSSFASMTRPTNTIQTKARAELDIYRRLKANPLAQKSFLESVLIPSVFSKLEDATPEIRFGRLKNIFIQLISGEEVVIEEEKDPLEPAPVVDAYKAIIDELAQDGMASFDNEEKLNAFTAFIENSAKREFPEGVEIVSAHSSERWGDTTQVMFVTGAEKPPSSNDLHKLFSEVLGYPHIRAHSSAAELFTQMTKHKEVVKTEPYVYFMGSDHYNGRVTEHFDNQTVEVNAFKQKLDTDASVDQIFIKSFIHRSKFQRALCGVFLTPEELVRLDDFDPRQRSMVMEYAISKRLELMDTCTNIFAAVGQPSETPTSIYADKAPAREVDNLFTTRSTANKDEKQTMTQPKSRDEAIAENVSKQLEVKIRGDFPGLSEDKIQKLVGAVSAILSPSQIRGQHTKGAPVPQPSETAKPSNLDARYPFSGFEKFFEDLGIPVTFIPQLNNPIYFGAMGGQVVTDTPTPAPQVNKAAAYEAQQKVPQLKSVDSTTVYTLDNGVQFFVSYDTETRNLSITTSAHGGNYGSQLVYAEYSQKDAEYIIASLEEGIEAGHPHKSVMLAVQRLAPVSLTGIAGMSYTPGFTNNW